MDERRALEEKAGAILSELRQAMVLGKSGQRAAYAFFTTLFLKMDIAPDWKIDTAATDGKTIFYNPEFITGLTREENMGVMIHEVLHCANKHHVRMGKREPNRFNLATDLAINPLIREAGFVLPRGAIFPGEGQFRDLPLGLSMEEYYRLLKDEPRPPDPGGCGEVTEPGPEKSPEMADAEWEVNLAQARNCAEKAQGNLPAGLSRMVEEVLTPKVNWREVLRDFVSRHARNNYGWNPPNRRYVWQGVYLPSLRGEELDGIYLAVDTSGSIGREELDRFAAEIDGIIEANASKLTILYHDDRVTHVQTWEVTDGPLILEAKGGGGTDHRPVFAHLDREERVACLVCLTDLCSTFPSQAPDYPVLWASTVKRAKAPFGTLVQIAE